MCDTPTPTTYPRDWEWVSDSPQTLRLQVPGGWLVQTAEYAGEGVGLSESLVFLPDPEYRWLLAPRTSPRPL
jgi:hypothetical protein